VKLREKQAGDNFVPFARSNAVSTHAKAVGSRHGYRIERLAKP